MNLSFANFIEKRTKVIYTDVDIIKSPSALC